MVQEISEKVWQAEARTEETRRFIRDIKRITRRRFTAEEKIRIVLEGFRCCILLDKEANRLTL
jgi:hypothetical protein